MVRIYSAFASADLSHVEFNYRGDLYLDPHAEELRRRWDENDDADVTPTDEMPVPEVTQVGGKDIT